jgi:mannose-1-phosphate guanylyltransferase/mannose-1-phosphate guanylyltransferase/mannose-6-phosphate isomerase
MFNDCIIMAGGSGTRLWPASSSRLPKQFLPAGKGSFFSMALERALTVTCDSTNSSDGRVIVITGNAHIPHVAAETAKLTAAEKKRVIVIGEPVARNTAPAIACAVIYSLLGAAGNSKNKSNRNMLVLTSDHIIKPLDAFKKDAALAAAAAAEGKLAVFGIPPKHPETGYGYIETGKKDGEVFKVTAFHEKPDLQTAKKYVASRNFFWNSGMFAFNNEFITRQFRNLAADVLLPFEKLKEPTKEAYTVSRGVKILNNWQGLKAAYNKVKSISFDYAIVEKCPNSIMVRTTFDWIDIGNWEEYIKVCNKSDSLVFNADADTCYVDSDIPVAIAGAEDLIVVIRSGKNGQPATALITKKGQTQKVRDIVEQIKKAGRTELL